MSAASKRNADLGLTDEEIAFYDALAANESALAAMGDATLKVIAAELITQVRKSVTIDWTLRESAKAKIRSPEHVGASGRKYHPRQNARIRGIAADQRAGGVRVGVRSVCGPNSGFEPLRRSDADWPKHDPP
jgi:hypothetical protein